MEKSRKRLREASLLVLIFSALTFIRVFIELLRLGLGTKLPTADVSRELMLVTMIAMCVVNLLLLIPQVYVGVKGLKLSKEPRDTKVHIIWAVVLLVCAVLGSLYPLSSLIDGVSVTDNAIILVDHMLDVIVYCMYIKYANLVQGGM